MFKKILIFAVVSTILSCGKDVVVKEEDPIPNDVDNVYEVNLVGLPHDDNGVYVPEVNFTISGSNITGDETGFFHTERQLVGNRGIVIEADKEGYLPLYKRIYHHNSLENVIIDVALIESPSPQIVSSNGLEFNDENNTKVIIEEGDLSVNSELTYYTDVIGDDRVTYIDNLLDGDVKELLDAKMLLYIDSDSELIDGQSVTIEVPNSKLESIAIGDLELFFYDEALNSWVVEPSILMTANQVNLQINRFGWWAIGYTDRAKYATLTLDQLGQPISNYKTKLTGGENTEVLYTDELGQISKYWPIDKSVEISFENSSVETEISFSNTDQSISETISEEVNYSLAGQVLSCDLELHTGYVAVLSEGQHTIIPIKNGEFVGNTSVNDEVVQLNFYNSNFESMTIQSAKVAEWKSTKASFVACEKTLSVKDNSSIIADFEKCRVKVNPFESLIIGEQEDDKVFMASFSGDQVGTYTGLLFSTADAFDISSTAEVEIQVYDEVSKTVAGKIDGAFLSGESFNISFVGNIE